MGSSLTTCLLRSRLYSSRHNEERQNHILEGQQRNMLQGQRNAHIHAYMYSFITSFFLGSYIIIQNAFTMQPKLHDACDSVCQCCVCKIVFVNTLCTSTTITLLPRRRLIRFGRHQEPRPLCLTESGRPACTAAEEARDARLATICYSLRITTVVRKTHAFTRKIARIVISTLVSRTPNPHSASNGGA